MNGAILLDKGCGLHYLVPSAKADGNEDAVCCISIFGQLKNADGNEEEPC